MHRPCLLFSLLPLLTFAASSTWSSPPLSGRGLEPPRSGAARRRQASDTPGRQRQHHDAVRSIGRGGSDGDGDGPEGERSSTYHGSYIVREGDPPPARQSLAGQQQQAVQQTSTSVAAPAAAEAAAVPTTLAVATSTSKKISNLQERTGPAVLALAAVGILLRFAGRNGLIALVLLLQVGMYSESTSVVERHGGGAGQAIASYGAQKWWWFATAVVATAGRTLLVGGGKVTGDAAGLISFGMAAAGLVGAVVSLAAVDGDDAPEVYRRYLGGAASCHFSLLFLIGQSSFWINTAREYGLVWVLFPALLVVVNDTMAYVFGVLLGKHKLLPRLSPKKTVEGFAGAALSTMAVAVPLLRRMSAGSEAGNLRRHAVALAAYVSLVSPFGGFLASAVKRAHGAKDFGEIMPGHGGVVDRFDCQVVTAPFVYLYLRNCVGEAGGSA